MFDFAPMPPKAPVSLQQSAVFNTALKRLGVGTAHHVLPGGSASVLMRHMAGLGRVGVVSRGPVWNGHDERHRVAGLVTMRRALGLRHLLINPEATGDAATMEAAGFLRVARPMSIAMLPLDGGPEDWLRRMDQKWRNRLRRGMRQGLTVERHERLGTDHWLFEADRKQQAARRYRNIPHAVLAEMARAEPGAIQVFIAREGREALAAMLFATHGGMASYQIGWNSQAGKRVCAHNLLMWEAMVFLRANGHGWLDLGRLNPKRTPGLDRFKLGTGAEIKALGGTWLDSAWAVPMHHFRRRAVVARYERA